MDTLLMYYQGDLDTAGTDFMNRLESVLGLKSNTKTKIVPN